MLQKEGFYVLFHDYWLLVYHSLTIPNDNILHGLARLFCSELETTLESIVPIKPQKCMEETLMCDLLSISRTYTGLLVYTLNGFIVCVW